jgi:hypothetical protein
MANNGYVDPELFLHDEIKAFRATKSQNWQIGVYRCQFFQNQSETVVLGNYHFLWSTPNKSVQQPEQPTIYEWLKIQNIYIYTYDYTHIFMYIYMCACVLLNQGRCITIGRERERCHCSRVNLGLQEPHLVHS